MLKKIALLLLLVAPMSLFAHVRAEVRALQINGHHPGNAGVCKGSNRHPSIAEAIRG